MTGTEEVIVFEPELKVGDEVKVAAGAFDGLNAVITQFLPAKERVKILVEFLGRSVEAEIDAPKILVPRNPRISKITGQND